MIRLFAGSTRDRVIPRSSLTAASLLLHLLAVAALLIPLQHLVRSALEDRPLVYLVPPNQDKPGRSGESPDAYHAPAAVAATRTETNAGELVIGQSDTAAFSAKALASMTTPNLSEESALTELDVDSTVVRDPASAAPSYPPSLLSQGITGFAAVRYVVDTLGLVDTLSYRVVQATHPDFAVAVRRALPEMRFRPAMQHGHRVRQWVEQTFHFRIQRKDTAPSI